ncbi:MAG: glycerol-3-phosphate dehydrogenase/oxidase [Pseudomonadota bacterium]
MSQPRQVDVLIIGAGINGAGVFRDLCEQGVTCAIIDKGDFGSGTSAAPSRLIHGGIKYLETGELGLVAESTLERNLLLRNAPHLVKPLQTVIPMFSWFKGMGAAARTLFGSTTAPRSRGAILVRIGLAVYDFYGRRQRVMPRHRFWSKAQAQAELPGLTDDAVAAGTYYDALVTAPERLVMELVQDGIRAQKQSVAMTYTGLESAKDGVVRVRDEAGTDHAFAPRIVINAAGPWIDRVNERLGAPSRLIGGTKGSHIILDNPDLVAMLDGRMIYYEANDGRICLVFDYLGKALVGSTDTRADDPDDVTCDADEIAYFLESLSALLPGIRCTQDQIVYAYSGIRPLPASDGTAVGLISRDHSAPVMPPTDGRPFGIISLVGGKWTTFRGFSEQVADTVLARLDWPRKTSTQDLAIGGGAGYPDDEDTWVANFSDPRRARVLLLRYGATARNIIEAEGDTPRLLGNALDYSVEEISWIAAHEQVVHLTDIVMRRTQIAVLGELSSAGLSEIAAVAAKVLNWDAARMKTEIADTSRVLAEKHYARVLGPDKADPQSLVT